ncbi:hypothetical protein MJO28_015923 [Puccinia striiformis f. sp. tritici]|uniref:Uncharacterized protein n=1 Tax=Puccinia striiformis f. sp. tritici TaxID=168172 RepID=A0ACC0DSX6_9BASI|nr:hypothetical protein MJO28_015923 [Puccinia striiformis f. sp. tritici]
MSPELYQGKLTPTTFPNPWRAKADGRIMRHVPITLYCDDTFGNQLKKWNKHISYYYTLSGLPPKVSNQEYLNQVVDYRDWNETIDRSHELWDKTVKGVKDDYKKYSKAFGVQDVITKGFVDILKDRKKKHEAKKILAIAEHKYYKLFNPFLRLLGFDGCHDTPVEVLHVILLGVIKYISNDFLTNTIKPKQANDLLGTWQSFITDSLDLPVLNAAYMYKHHRSMIGKDFKILLQCAPFVFYQFMNEPQQDLWQSGGSFIGQIHSIWRVSSRNSFNIKKTTYGMQIEQFEVAEVSDYYQMRILKRSRKNIDIIHCLNVRHNCHEGRCKVKMSSRDVNDTHEGNPARYMVDHSPTDSFILNTCSFHESEAHRDIASLELQPVPSREFSHAIRMGLESGKQKKIYLTKMKEFSPQTTILPQE